MTKVKVVLALVGAAVVASTFAAGDASAKGRKYHYVIRQPGCFDRLPAYGVDGCGFREFGYGPGSCFRRVEAYTRYGPVARRVSICG